MKNTIINGGTRVLEYGTWKGMLEQDVEQINTTWRDEDEDFTFAGLQEALLPLVLHPLVPLPAGYPIVRVNTAVRNHLT